MTLKRTLDVKRITIKPAEGSDPYFDSNCIGQPDNHGNTVTVESCCEVLTINGYPDPLSCKIKPDVHRGKIDEALNWLGVDDQNYKNILAFKNDYVVSVDFSKTRDLIFFVAFFDKYLDKKCKWMKFRWSPF